MDKYRTHVGALFLCKDEDVFYMKTDKAQNGFIKLASGKAKVNYGDLLEISAYLKADHFAKGLSLLLDILLIKNKKLALCLVIKIYLIQ